MQNCVSNCVFEQKSKNTTTTKQKINIQTLAGAANLTSNLSYPMRIITFAPQSQLRIRIVVDLFTCLETIGQNVNKHNRICGPHNFNYLIQSVIVIHALITIYGSFSY